MVKNLVKTRIPTGYGEFTLYLYAEHGKEHLALVIGDVAGKPGVPVRVHSECLTGDVFGSRRCDCGDQLRHTLQYLGRAETGILIYLRQEGRGIGLRKKMEAYNLQDQGMDTVEANIRLGHQPDERDYGIAARILGDLEVHSIRLITNNPHKVEALQGHGVDVEARIPIEVGHHRDNLDYLRSKAEKMAHLLSFRERMPEHHELAFIEPLIDQLSLVRSANHNVPFVTLAYAQSMDGHLMAEGASRPRSQQAQSLTHHLRSHHDGLLIDVDAIPDGDPRLDAMDDHVESSRRVILDSHLRTPPECHLLRRTGSSPIFLTTTGSSPAQREALAARGVDVVPVNADAEGRVNLREALSAIVQRGIRTLLVEGGHNTISTLLNQHLVNYCVITITPQIAGNLDSGDDRRLAGQVPLTLADCRYQPQGADIVAYGPVRYG